MPDSVTMPDELLPVDSGYYYSSLLPFRQKVDSQGHPLAGVKAEWTLPGALRDVVNSAWLAATMPGNALAGKYSQQDMERLAPKAAMAMTGLSAAPSESVAEDVVPTLARSFSTNPAKLADEHELMMRQLYGDALKGAQDTVPIARGNIEDIIGPRIDELMPPSLGRDVSNNMAQSELWGAAPQTPRLPPTIAWHGTPHTFEPVEGNPFGAFADSAIGSGEGAQVYGHGHYIAGNEETGRMYQTCLSQQFHGTPLKGNLYKVQINAPSESLLPWDEVIPKDLASKIKESTPGLFGVIGDNTTGQDLYKTLTNKYGSDTMASKVLANAGIPGIRYADAGSRSLNMEHGGVELNGENLTGPFIDPNKTFNGIMKHLTGKPDPADWSRTEIMHGRQVREALTTLHDYGSADAAMAALNVSASSPQLAVDAARSAGASEWIRDNSKNISFAPAKKPTSNYVIFHPSNLKIVGRNGEELGLMPVDHDPFGGTQ